MINHEHDKRIKRATDDTAKIQQQHLTCGGRKDDCLLRGISARIDNKTPYLFLIWQKKLMSFGVHGTAYIANMSLDNTSRAMIVIVDEPKIIIKAMNPPWVHQSFSASLSAGLNT
jgi:hypothetical protein